MQHWGGGQCSMGEGGNAAWGEVGGNVALGEVGQCSMGEGGNAAWGEVGGQCSMAPQMFAQHSVLYNRL